MTAPSSLEGEQRSLIQWIDDTAGYGALRAEALVAMLRPFDCTVNARRGATGLRSVHIYGPPPVVDYLRDQLDGWLTALDTAAKAATRRYGTWLRDQDDHDHMPAERRNLTRAYRRQYMPIWADAWAARLVDLVAGRDSDPVDAPPIGHTGAHAAARHDVAKLDPQPLRDAVAVVQANDRYGRHAQPASASVRPPVGSVRPDGPGRIAPGQRVTCLPGSLPRRDGGRGGGVLVSIGAKTSLVDVYGGRRRRIPNQLLHPEVGPWIAADRDARGLRTARASGRGWLPGWSWLGWTLAEHLEYIGGQRHLPSPPAAPQRLVIVACGARKTACFEAPAGEMYVDSYHRAARRAADAITTPGTRVMILSARYGLLDLDEVILRYECRLGQRHAITAQGLREQAQELGLADTAEVIVLAPAAYAELAAQVWPHALLPLTGTRGIGVQMARLAALATGRTTVADMVDPQPGNTVPERTLATPTGDEHTVSIRGGLVHLAHTPPGPARALVPTCAADQPGRQWRLTHATISCTRCAAILAGRRALDRWCALVDRAALGAPRLTDESTREASQLTDPSHPQPYRPGPVPRSQPRRPTAPRRPGGTPRRRTRDAWRLVPSGAGRDVPLVSAFTPSRDPASRRRRPRHPRPPMGERRRASVVAGPRDAAVPLTPATPLIRANTDIANRSAHGFRRRSTCTTRPSLTGGTLAEPLRPAEPGHRGTARTTRPPRRPRTFVSARPGALIGRWRSDP